MQFPNVGTTCKYTFIPEFASLNGIYTLVQTELYETALSGGVDFLATLYTPAGLTQDNYNADWKNYSGLPVGQLQSITDSTVVLNVPEYLLSVIPDPTVKQYQNLYIGIVLGYFGSDEATQISYILNELKQIATSVAGTTNTPHIFSSGSTWMTDADYQVLVTERQQNISSIQTFFQANQAAQTIIEQLKAKIAYYEAGLIAAQANVSQPTSP